MDKFIEKGIELHASSFLCHSRLNNQHDKVGTLIRSFQKEKKSSLLQWDVIFVQATNIMRKTIMGMIWIC
jgi:hypothetical protein